MKLRAAPYVSVLATALCVAACAGVPARSQAGPDQYAQVESEAQSIAGPSAPFNLSGYDRDYRRGFADGCKSRAGTQQRNDQLYRSDTDYMMGWNDGHGMCARR